MTYPIQFSLLPLITCLNLGFMRDHENACSVIRLSQLLPLQTLKNSVASVPSLFQMILLVNKQETLKKILVPPRENTSVLEEITSLIFYCGSIQRKYPTNTLKLITLKTSPGFLCFVCLCVMYRNQLVSFQIIAKTNCYADILI